MKPHRGDIIIGKLTNHIRKLRRSEMKHHGKHIHTNLYTFCVFGKRATKPYSKKLERRITQIYLWHS